MVIRKKVSYFGFAFIPFLYINDSPNLLVPASSVLSADDTSLHLTHCNSTQVHLSKLQVDHLDSSLSANAVILNISISNTVNIASKLPIITDASLLLLLCQGDTLSLVLTTVC